MADVIAQAVVEVTADARRFGAGLRNDVQVSLRQVTKTADDAGKKVGRSLEGAAKHAGGLSKALNGVATVAGGVLTADLFQNLGQRATDFLRGTTRAASDLEQSIGGVNSIFGDSAAQIHEWARPPPSRTGSVSARSTRPSHRSDRC